MLLLPPPTRGPAVLGFVRCIVVLDLLEICGPQVLGRSFCIRYCSGFSGEVTDLPVELLSYRLLPLDLY